MRKFRLVLIAPLLSFLVTGHSLADIYKPWEEDYNYPPYEPEIPPPTCEDKARQANEDCMDKVEDLYNYCDDMNPGPDQDECYGWVWDDAVGCDEANAAAMKACDPPPPVPPIENGPDPESTPEPIPDPNA